MSKQFKDMDPAETLEWLDALEAVIANEGLEKTKFLIEELRNRASLRGIASPYEATTPYANTIPPDKSARMPSDSLVARNVAAFVRWNAMAMVAKANKDYEGIGGHIASFASSAVLYEVGFDYFFKGPESPGGGDLVFFQGHSSPGIYARAFLEGRLTEEDLKRFRREVFGKGVSSYPHPFLMPDFWQFPTVSMGLGPIQAIYQARFMKYLQARGMVEENGRKVWAFVGDGETDEPETLGAISLAARENLDNLIFVINCNLQRLDGPVRGNGKIIQELEGHFRGIGWNIIKVIWGTEWDRILERDEEGILLQRFNEMVDGEFQALRAKDGAYIRKKLFESDPKLEELVADISDADIWQMTRGGHDPRKVYAAFAAAVAAQGQPTVILVQTIKGFGMGKAGESANITHSQKKMDSESLKVFRDRFHVPLTDEELDKLPFIKPDAESDEAEFIRSRRKELGGGLPARRNDAPALEIPDLNAFSNLLEGSGDREMSTTMAFVRFLSALGRDKKIGKLVVPIVSDEARTFGMEGLFRQMGIYAPAGQLYEPEDAESMMWYREDAEGQILEEGITEAGSMASWIAAGTAYANHGINLIPFYSFYSMFGFQRIGDLAWLAGDIRARGFLMGATSGRTTLNGEGLQHQDGHSLLVAGTIPNCQAYDPTFAYELVVLIHEGMRRMYVEQEDTFYYITLLNENYTQPALPDGGAEGIVKGMYLFQEATKKKNSKKHVQLMGSGSILKEAIAAAELLETEYDVTADVWSVPGITQLHRDGMSVERYNRLHPGSKEKVPYVTQLLSDRTGPAVMATDYVRAYPEQLRNMIPMPYTVLGTDGFGRSDTRPALRSFFEVDRYHIVVAALSALSKMEIVEPKDVSKAIETYEIDPDRADPRIS